MTFLKYYAMASIMQFCFKILHSAQALGLLLYIYRPTTGRKSQGKLEAAKTGDRGRYREGARRRGGKAGAGLYIFWTAKSGVQRLCFFVRGVAEHWSEACREAEATGTR